MFWRRREEEMVENFSLKIRIRVFGEEEKLRGKPVSVFSRWKS